MKFLAEGGYIIDTYAKLMYPGGIEIDGDDVVGQTNKLLEENENVILFEAAIEHGGCLFRVDILEKSGNTLKVIEVKSKSWDSSKDKKFKPADEKYRDDALFQAIKVKDALPEYEVKVSLLMPDKAKCTNIDQLHNLFNVIEVDTVDSDFTRHIIKLNFALGSEVHEQLKEDSILYELELDDDLLENEAKLRKQIYQYTTSYTVDGVQKIECAINKDCKKCEFNAGAQKNGFRECWGELADPDPHVFELYYGGTLANDGMNELISQGKTSLYDVNDEMLLTKKCELGSRGMRQKIQIDNTRENTEWISEDLKGILRSYDFPLYFIDFETATSALPPFKGMRPYEQIAFQWSCHIVRNLSDPPEHHEYICRETKFPNFEFAESLMKLIGDQKNLFMWAPHENTILNAILEQMDKYHYDNPALKSWLERVVKKDKNDSGLLIDMNKLTFDHYFHPDMKGRTSIKKTMPAIWMNNPYLHKNSWFKKYVDYDDGEIIDPYQTLGNHIDIFEETDLVKEGTAAMRAYFEMNFGQHANDESIRQNWCKSLLNYCELDTMSMVMVWYHWRTIQLAS